jgi:uncharacterized protein YndB with AHSA1/START domain
VSTHTETPPDSALISMTRIYDAPRALVWEAMTEPEHVRKWWGGPGFSSPVCEMDLRPGGHWRHVLRFPDGTELAMHFIFVEVRAPERLVWRHVEQAVPLHGIVSPEFTATLAALGERTRYQLVARFASLAERDAALAVGFTGPIAASHEAFAEYLKLL